MNKKWIESSWEECEERSAYDKKFKKKVIELIKDIERHPFTGIGKPEPLKDNMSGWWSRHINDTDRLIYRVQGNDLEILECIGHYNDK